MKQHQVKMAGVDNRKPEIGSGSCREVFACVQTFFFFSIIRIGSSSAPEVRMQQLE